MFGLVFFPLSFSVVVLRDIIPKFPGIPEADAGREGWELFPILPSVVQILPGIPSTLLYPFGMEFSTFFWEFQRFNPKSIQEASLVSFLISHPLFFFPWVSSRIPDQSKGQNSRPYSSFLGNFLGEIINIYNLEIYIY